MVFRRVPSPPRVIIMSISRIMRFLDMWPLRLSMEVAILLSKATVFPFFSRYFISFWMYFFLPSRFLRPIRPIFSSFLGCFMAMNS